MQFFIEPIMSDFSQISYLLATEIKVTIRNYVKKSLTFSILHYSLLNDTPILQKKRFVWYSDWYFKSIW